MNQVLDGAEIIALHKGRFHEALGGLVLDSGAFVAALEHATGKQAIVVGKPTQTFLNWRVILLAVNQRNWSW